MTLLGRTAVFEWHAVFHLLNYKLFHETPSQRGVMWQSALLIRGMQDRNDLNSLLVGRLVLQPMFATLSVLYVATAGPMIYLCLNF